MYQSIYKWDEAIDVAEAKVNIFLQTKRVFVTFLTCKLLFSIKNHPDLEKLKKTFNQWLNDTEQYEIAAAVKEKEGAYTGAINLYLRASLPIKAAKVLMGNKELMHNQDLVISITKSLIESDLYENVSFALMFHFISY